MTSPMKVLIPNYRTPDSFVDNVAHTLIKMGHSVTTMPAISNQNIDAKYKVFLRLAKQVVLKDNWTLQEKWLEKELKHNTTYDLLLTLTQALPEELLHEAKKKGMVTAVWWGDTPANMKKHGLLVDGWDKIFIKDQNAVKKLHGLGLDASLLHEAMNPDWHKPLYTHINNEVVVAGSFYDYRNYLVDKLLAKDVEMGLYGRRLSKWVSQRIKAIHREKFIVREDKSRIFGSGLACLNSTAMSEFDSLNCRAFEIAGAEGLQFLEYRASVHDCFEDGTEIKTFKSIEELIGLIDWAKKAPHEALRVRQAGHKRAMAEHTYEHRLNYIFNTINS